MAGFVEREMKRVLFEHSGRIILRDDHLLVYIDGDGRYSIKIPDLALTLAGFGPSDIFSGEGIAGEARMSESGRGVDMIIHGIPYVSPAVRVRAVLAGKHKKGPVSRRLQGD